MLQISHHLIQSVTPRPIRPGQDQDDWDAYVQALTSQQFSALLERYRVTTKALAYYLGQNAHECGGWTLVRERTNYSVKRMLEIFGEGNHSACLTHQEACSIYALKGEDRGRVLFERVYGLGNPRKAAELGNIEDGDGYFFRGTGPGQITGRKAQERIAKKVGCTVAQLGQPLYGLHAALVEWQEKGLFALAERDDIRGITRRINGGFNGLQERTELTNAFLAALGQEGVEIVDREQAADAQKRLNELHYTLGTPDGDEDHASRAAVFAFQDANGIVPTGVLDRVTIAAILSPDAKPLPVPPERAALTSKDLLQRGSRDIAQAQADKEKAFLGLGGTFLSLLDYIFGGKGLDAISSFASKINTLLAQFGGSLSSVPPRALAAFVVAGICVWFWQRADARETRRLEKARTGADLSK